MYHFIVRQQLRKAFRQLNQGDYGSIRRQFAPHFEHIFPGDHPLGGARHTHESIHRWYDRLAALFPDLRFRVKAITVSGWPWDTQASVEWADQLTAPDGKPFNNVGVHLFRLKWGRVVSLRVYCDTERLIEVCRYFAQQGVTVAGAAPITD